MSIPGNVHGIRMSGNSNRESLNTSIRVLVQLDKALDWFSENSREFIQQLILVHFCDAPGSPIVPEAGNVNQLGI